MGTQKLGIENWCLDSGFTQRIFEGESTDTQVHDTESLEENDVSKL